MKLGLLGPAGGDLAALGRAAELLVSVAKVDRAIYLGPDDALERTVGAWAKRLVGDDPTETAMWRRATELAVAGSPAEIDGFVEKERARLALRVFESLPGGQARTIEMVGDRVAVLVYEKALLDEEDIFAANLILYGKSDQPVVRRIGARWFVTPGRIGSSGGGACVLDDGGDDVVVTIYDDAGKARHREALTVVRSTKMRVQGGAP
jgi:hypothetical protein